MIKVTRLNHQELVINADHIEFVEGTPDTVISLVSGKKMVVSESVDEIISRVVAYKQAIAKINVQTDNN
ncbi:MAG TPA: flagellar FlbD family protein [Bacillota bacterium]|nr:flagellar FlbD family protein [Bacillota bacterium]